MSSFICTSIVFMTCCVRVRDEDLRGCASTMGKRVVAKRKHCPQRGRCARRRLLSFPSRILKCLNVADARQSMLNSSFSVASMFSGMGTPEAALSMLTLEASKLGLSLNPHTVSACDSSPTCRKLLDKVLDDDVCLHADVMDYVADYKRNQLMAK